MQAATRGAEGKAEAQESWLGELPRPNFSSAATSRWLWAGKHSLAFSYQFKPGTSSFCPKNSTEVWDRNGETRLMGLIQNTKNVFPPKYENNTWSRGVIIGFPSMTVSRESYKCPLIILLRISSLDFFLPFLFLLLSFLPSFLLQ